MSGAGVLQVTGWDRPYPGNLVATQLRLAAEVRDRLGLATHLVLGEAAGERPWLDDLIGAGVSWSVLPAGGRAARAHLRTTVRRYDAALVHSHLPTRDAEVAAAAHAVRAPYVEWLQGAADAAGRRRWGRRRAPDRVVVPAPELAPVAERRGVARQRIVVLPDAIAAERFADLPARADARAALGLPDTAEVVLAFASRPHDKGADVLLDALRRLVVRRPRAIGLLVGDHALRAFAAEHLADRPAWLRLSRHVDDPGPLFAAADVFVSASRHEPRADAVGEALACGLPVIMSATEGTRRYAAAPEVAAVRCGDAAALAAALEGLLSRPVRERRAAGRRNRAWAADELDVERWCACLCDLYAELLDSDAAGGVRAITRRTATTSRLSTSPTPTSVTR